MMRELTPQQQLFAEIVLESIRDQPRLTTFFAGLRTGKTFVFNTLEEYLRHNPPQDPEHFRRFCKGDLQTIGVNLQFKVPDKAPKAWRPVLVNPKAFYTHQAYGITDERRIELSNKMADMMQSLVGVSPVYAHLDGLADIADNAAEFAYCVYVHAAYLQKTGGNLT